MSYLPRLPAEFYQGDAVVHWVLPIELRKQGWLTNDFHHDFREMMFHAGARECLLCPVYCLMPDHIHLMWMGLSPESDQRNAMAFVRTYLEPKLARFKFQHQAWDHVLSIQERKRGAFAATCNYILRNPVGANLVQCAEAWPFSGSVVPGYAAFSARKEGFWLRFWKIYFEQRDPACANRVLPLRGG